MSKQEEEERNANFMRPQEPSDNQIMSQNTMSVLIETQKQQVLLKMDQIKNSEERLELQKALFME